ncbi:MAG TPA: hypothetical protein VL947_01880 [Cytophagales bacterium]|nr:hypothetical protein [Cytophagales bacterium]
MSELLDVEEKKLPEIKVQTSFIVIEIILLVTAFIGTLFKIMHWPGATFLLIIGISFYCIMMFPIGLFYRNWQLKVLNFMINLVALGILWKLMSWPGFKLYNSIGIIAAIIALVLLVVVYRTHSPVIKENKFIVVRTLLLTTFCILLGSLGGKNYYRSFVENDPIGMELYEKMNDNPNDAQARKAYIKYRSSRYKQFNTPDSTNGQQH